MLCYVQIIIFWEVLVYNNVRTQNTLPSRFALFSLVASPSDKRCFSCGLTHIDGAHLAPEHQASLPTCLRLFRQARPKPSTMNLTNGATNKTVLDRFMRLDIGHSEKVCTFSHQFQVYAQFSLFLDLFRLNVCTFGSMELVRESGPRPRLSNLFRNCPLVSFVFSAKIVTTCLAFVLNCS